MIGLNNPDGGIDRDHAVDAQPRWTVPRCTLIVWAPRQPVARRASGWFPELDNGKGMAGQACWFDAEGAAVLALPASRQLLERPHTVVGFGASWTELEAVLLPAATPACPAPCRTRRTPPSAPWADTAYRSKADITLLNRRSLFPRSSSMPRSHTRPRRLPHRPRQRSARTSAAPGPDRRRNYARLTKPASPRTFNRASLNGRNPANGRDQEQRPPTRNG